jgi:ABC-type proline/glycine betaine transport system permease subunit
MMIPALLFISVCLNILAALIMGVLIGRAERRKKISAEFAEMLKKAFPKGTEWPGPKG